MVTLQVFYYVPDYRSILNEFVWQADDIVPELPRIHRFLNYWKDQIDAVIKDVLITSTLVDGTKFVTTDIYKKLH